MEPAAAADPAAHLARRVAAAPVLELLRTAAPGEVRFRLRCPDTGPAHGLLAQAMHAAGLAEIGEALADGRPALSCRFEAGALPGRADAIANAAIVLGAIAARGHAVPQALIDALRADGLPSYIGFAGLWRLELSGIDIAMLGPLLEARLAGDPQDAAAMMDIATLSILTLIPENRAPAFALQARALAREPLYRMPARRPGTPLRVLAIACPGDMTALTHLDCLLEDADVELLMLYARPDRPLPAALPEHDLVFVAIGESGPNRPLLEQAAAFEKASAKPVLNRAARILELSRDRVSARLGGVAGIEMPQTARVVRADLERVSRGELPIETIFADGRFPLIARPVDSQGGKDLVRLEDRAALAAWLQATPADACFVSRFVDYRGPDGLYRKYRVVLIAGRAYACHMAVSAHWMIHYVNADMDECAEKRAEEALFMAGFDAGFGARHGEALARIDRLLGLDYYGIDCAETRDGRLLVFEADTAMLVHAMDSTTLYPYKGPQMERLFAAFRAMLGAAAGAPSGARRD